MLQMASIVPEYECLSLIAIDLLAHAYTWKNENNFNIIRSRIEEKLLAGIPIYLHTILTMRIERDDVALGKTETFSNSSHHTLFMC